MDHSERKQKIEVIRRFPAELQAAIQQVPGGLDGHTGGPDEWTVRQVVHHCADAHIHGFIRMKLVVAEERPLLKPYDQDVWVRQADNSLPVEPSLQILSGLHQRWAVFLESLPENAWERCGVHLENGLMSLDQLLNVYASHCQGHLEQVRKA